MYWIYCMRYIVMDCEDDMLRLRVNFYTGSCVLTNYTFYIINKIQAVSYQDDESEGEDPASSGEESDFEEDAAPKQKKKAATKKKAAPKSKGKGKKSTTDKNTVSALLQELDDGSPTVTFDDPKSGGGKLTQLVTGDEYETNDDWRIGGLF